MKKINFRYFKIKNHLLNQYKLYIIFIYFYQYNIYSLINNSVN